MTNTKQQLSAWSDSQILQSLTPKFDKLIEYWQGGSHPEVLWDDGYYCEVISKRLTEEDKKKWFKLFDEDDCNEVGATDFDDLLESCDYLGEDIGDWFSRQPENRNEFIVFTFKWLLNYEGDNFEEVLIPFLAS